MQPPVVELAADAPGGALHQAMERLASIGSLPDDLAGAAKRLADQARGIARRARSQHPQHRELLVVPVVGQHVQRGGRLGHAGGQRPAALAHAQVEVVAFEERLDLVAIHGDDAVLVQRNLDVADVQMPFLPLHRDRQIAPRERQAYRACET